MLLWCLWCFSSEARCGRCAGEVEALCRRRVMRGLTGIGSLDSRQLLFSKNVPAFAVVEDMVLSERSASRWVTSSRCASVSGFHWSSRHLRKA